MKAALPLVLMFANLAMSQLFTGGLTTDLTPPTSSTFATGFGTSTVFNQGPLAVSSNGALGQVVTTGGNTGFARGPNSVFGLGSAAGIVGPGSFIRTDSGILFVSPAGGPNGGSIINRQFQQFGIPVFGNGALNFPEPGGIPRPVLLVVNNPAVAPRTVSIVRFRRSH